MNKKEISLREVISYSKQKEVPSVTIISDLSNENMAYIKLMAERLNLVEFKIKKQNMMCIIGNANIAKKIALNLNKKCQKMFYDFVRRPSGSITIYALTGYTKEWITLRDNGYIVEAFDEKGNEIAPYIKTNILKIKPLHLNKLKLSIYKASVRLKGTCGNYYSQILEISRANYLNGGSYNKAKNCYILNGNSQREIANNNKLNKLFKKYGFNKL